MSDTGNGATSTDGAAPTSADTGEGQTPAQPNPDTITRKVDGQMVTETRQQIIERLSKLSNEELANWDSISAASQKRFDLAARQLQEANQEKRNMAELKSALNADDPVAIEEALSKMGVDARKAAEKVLWRHYQREKATPQQRREMELTEREKKLADQERARQEAEQSQQFQAQVEELYDQLSEEIAGVFEEAGVELDEEAEAELVPRVAYYIDAVRQATGQMPTTHEVVAHIRKIDAQRSEKTVGSIMADLEAGKLDRLTPKAREAVRKALVAEFSRESPNDGKAPAAPRTSNGAPKGPPVYKPGDLESFKKATQRRA